MIYVGFFHTWIPRFSGILSFIFNPLFFYLVWNKTKSPIGSYKYILVCFAIFNMSYSAVELAAGMGSHGYGDAFVVFIAHGPFYYDLHVGLIALSIRCGFIALSYGILVIHFIYRYIALCRPEKLYIFTTPKWVVALFVFFITHGVLWAGSCYFFLHGDGEMQLYLDEEFKENYNVSAFEVPMLGTVFDNVSKDLTYRTVSGILVVTAISCYAITLYCILGFLIHRKLHEFSMSDQSKKMHKQLLAALVTQTVIPMTVSYMPCLIAWYTPWIGINVGKFNNYCLIIFLSFFPFCDPIAIICILPDYRKAALIILGLRKQAYRNSTSSGFVKPSVVNPTNTMTF